VTLTTTLRRLLAPSPQPQRPSWPPGPPAWPGLYLGAGPNGPVCAGGERAALVLGPPRSGKTSTIVIPTVLSAPGAVVATSTKTDVLAVTSPARSRRGRVWLFDPSGTLETPPGVVPLRFSPVPGCADWDVAVATAHALVRAARPGAGLEHTQHWTERAEALLAPLLHAADLIGVDISWPLRWVNRHDLTEPLNILAARGTELAADTLCSVHNTEERERSAICSTTSGVLAAYRSARALAAAAHPNFNPAAFVASADTVHIAAPAHAQEQTAPLVVALLDRIRQATYTRPSGAPPVVWALDEAATIAPVPSLPTIAAEGGGQGLIALVCLQDLSQARQRWGAAADGFFSLFAAKLILPGIGDTRTLQAISAIAGDHDVSVTSHSRPNGPALLWPRGSRAQTTTSLRRQPRLPVDQIHRGYPGMALLLTANYPPSWVQLTPWWTPPWSTLTQPAPTQQGGPRP